MKHTALLLTLLSLILLPACVTVSEKLAARGGLTWYRVERVISGDTIILKGVGSLKYIGVNAPERSLSGKSGEPRWEESLRKNRELVEGKWVRFEKDLKEEDEAGRTLAYVFVACSDFEEIFVNGEMLRTGLARLEESTVNTKYIMRLEALENRARSRGAGIWSGR